MPTRTAAAWMALVAALVAAVYLLRLDGAAGLIVDDAWYIVLGKALAQGDGYRLISSAATQIVPVAPPGFPALLSVVFRANPSFPDNLVWLKLISILAIAGMAVACWLDFRRNRGLAPAPATLLVVAIVITPSIVFLATSTVMAESVYTLAQVVAVILIERITRRDGRDMRAPVAAGLATGLAMLVRMAGVAVVMAAIAYLVMARRWRQAALYSLTVAVCLAPWQLYYRVNAPTFEESLAHGGTVAFNYQQLLAMERLNDPRGGVASIEAMSRRMAQNVFGVLGKDVGAILVPAFYRGPYESGQEVVSIGGSMGVATETMIISLVLSAIVLAGWLGAPRERMGMPGLLLAASLVVIAPVGGQTFRYIVPLTPYLIWLFWQGLRKEAVARIAVACLVAFHLMDHTLYVQQKMTATTDWLVDARENEELLTWMSTNLTEPGPVAATNPGLVYLRTGRKAVASVYLRLNWDRWKASGVRYVVSTTIGGAEPPRGTFNARLLYRTSRRRLWIVEM